MRPFHARKLSPAEQAIGREVFGDAFDLSGVRILGVPVWKRPFVAGARLIVWPRAALPADFADAALGLQGTFVHELTHVWQAQQGVFLPWAKIQAGDRARSYAYDLISQPDFAALNIEQQAMVVQHAFLAARGGRTPHPEALYAAASSAWRRA